ncbi:hypothetical protein SAMN05421509_101534 [Chromohalobacter canadensis]|uniref:Uncharacterized protein n=1 Tax=Chromohalobacter canadensis TaxID=141389 RepID=A0A285VEZ3_9GAMM|nr:hypothetical protein [Chromohalobacter canadensis]SOC52138.1 hypothetical protein SAMN05421509_101534 [Chromohalobacter canadensis]
MLHKLYDDGQIAGEHDGTFVLSLMPTLARASDRGSYMRRPCP